MQVEIDTNKLFSATNDNQYIVWDAMMSSGKTQTIIKYMLEQSTVRWGAKQDKFIYISPYLSEAHRIAGTEAIEGDDLQRPRKVRYDDPQYEDALLLNGGELPTYYNLELEQSQLGFLHPNQKNKDGSKETGFKLLVESGANIVSTHNLFKLLSLANSLDIDLSDYTLVIDEALETLMCDDTFTASELNKFFENNILAMNDDGVSVQFLKENFGRVSGTNVNTTEGTRYEYIADACNKGLVYRFGNRVVTKFDATILTMFKKTIIMTYNYKGSMFDLALKQQGIDPHIEHFGLQVSDIKHLITINEDEKMNSVGVSRNPKTMVKSGKYPVLTATYFKDDAKGTKRVAYPNVNKFFYNKLFNLWCQKEKVDIERRLWTCFKDDAVSIGKGSNKTNRFGASFLAFNKRATNDYAETDHLAFLINVYLQPDFVKASSYNEWHLHRDHYSLNVLIQWIFRSAIRKHQPINLYIPSERMRNLLKGWLNGEVITYATKADDMTEE